jgi:hypothetical protein
VEELVEDKTDKVPTNNNQHCRGSMLGRGKSRLLCIRNSIGKVWNWMNDCDSFLAMAIKTFQAIIIASVIGYPMLMLVGILYLVWAVHVPVITQWCLWVLWVGQWLFYEGYLAFLEYAGALKRLSN